MRKNGHTETTLFHFHRIYVYSKRGGGSSGSSREHHEAPPDPPLTL